jgi:hypothetical protein
MAKTVSVVVTDDLDGSPGAETVAFGFDGHSYEIDLGKKNRARLQKSLQPAAGPLFAGRRRRPGPPVPGSTGQRCALGLPGRA